MTDHQISANVWLIGASSGTDLTEPTTADIANLTNAIALMASYSGVDIDDIITSRWDVGMRTPAQMKAHGETLADGSAAWGYTHPLSAVSHINNALGALADDPNNKRKMQYTMLHEVGGHGGDQLKLNRAKRVSLMAIMDPPGPTTGTDPWNAGAYRDEPNECNGDTFPRAYAGINDILQGWYGRQVHAADWPTFRSIYGAAGSAASTTLAAAALAGATNIKLASMTGLAANDWLKIGTGATAELVQAQTVGTAGSGGTGVTLTAGLAFGHSSGEAAVESTAPPPPGSNGQVDKLVVANTPNASLASVTFDGLAPGTTGTVAMRFHDGTEWGPWSNAIDVAIAMTTGKPTQLTVTPGTLTPDFAATLPGDNLIQGYRIFVRQQTGAGPVLKWSKGPEVVPVGTTHRIQLAYGGDPLSWDQNYEWQIWLTGDNWRTPGGDPIWDQDHWAISDWTPFTPSVDAGPLITYGSSALDLSYKIDTLEPTFRLADRNGGNIDQARLREFDATGTTLLWDSGVIEFTAAAYHDVDTPAGYLAWGLNPKISGAVRIAGQAALGPFSEPKAVHVNAAPGAPFPVTVRSDTAQVVRRPDDRVWVIGDDRPTIVLPFRDIDVDLGYTEAPSRREIELRDLGDAHVGASPYVITTTITDEWTIPAAILLADTTYKVRGDFDDSADVRSGFSDYALIRYSAPPTLSSVAPASGATVIDPTPDVTWIYASAAGKAQAGYEINLSIAGDPLYASGYVITAAGTAHIPPGTLDTGESIDGELIVYDTDGLYARVPLAFTTAFTQPAEITGLVAAPDEGTMAILATWDASTDPAFSAYLVRIKFGNRQYRLVETITDIGTTSIYIRAAGHNTETVVRVTQTNDWRESEPAEVSATLGGERGTDDLIRGYWLKRPEQLIELPRAKHGQGDTVTDLELFDPPERRDPDTGRREKVILDWGSRGYEGTITIRTQDRELIRTLRRWKEEGLVAILATPYGAVRYIRLTSTPDTDDIAWWINGAITYIEVQPSAANF